jgi:hypothetical protein
MQLCGMFFYISAEVLRQGEAIFSENYARFACVCAFFVVPLQAE